MASGPLADFARMPTSRKVLVFAVVGALLGGLYYRFVYSGLRDRVDAAKAAYESTAGRHAAAVANLKKFGELRPEREKLLVELARDQAALPTEAEVPAFLETLERKVKESGVEILKWQKRNEEPVETFIKVPVEIEITGTFMQIKRFFASLVQRNVGPVEADDSERIVSIEALSIAQPQVRDRQIYLIAKFTAVTFRVSPPKTAPAPAPLAPRSRAGAATNPPPPPASSPSEAAPPPASSPPPSPSSSPSGAPAGEAAGAAGPGGVKARVEDAMKQGGEARVQEKGL